MLRPEHLVVESVVLVLVAAVAVHAVGIDHELELDAGPLESVNQLLRRCNCLDG